MSRLIEMNQGKNAKNKFFNNLEKWFITTKLANESIWTSVIAKYGEDILFGEHLRWAGHQSKINDKINEHLNIKFNWHYKGGGKRNGFYFNIIGSDLNQKEFTKLAVELQALLGTPDDISTYYGFDEPSWKSEHITLRLFHVDTHGNGYERIEIEMDKDILKNDNKNT